MAVINLGLNINNLMAIIQNGNLNVNYRVDIAGSSNTGDSEPSDIIASIIGKTELGTFLDDNILKIIPTTKSLSVGIGETVNTIWLRIQIPGSNTWLKLSANTVSDGYFQYGGQFIINSMEIEFAL